jgi:hypothetical protein
VFVDDFKLSGPQVNLIKGWALIRRSVQTDEPQPVNKYQLNKVLLKRCAVGLESDKGVPMVKPWTIATYE